MKRIPATIVTGFLGAGKTSLIRHLIETANGHRIALIINEFGDLGIDREIVTGCGLDGCADLVVLNKTDLLAGDDHAAVERDIAAHLRAGVHTVAAAHGRLDAAVLLGLGAGAEDDVAARRSVHDGAEEHDHDDFESFTIAPGAIADPARFERRLKDAVAGHDILRIKRFLDVPGKARRLVVQGVGDRFQRYFDRDWRADETRRSELVVIGRTGLDRAAIAAVLVPGTGVP